MNTENWNRALDVLDAAIALPLAERESFLASACGDDVALLEEVREMLVAYGGDSFLEHPPAVAAGSSTGAGSSVASGTQPGRVQTGSPDRARGPTAFPRTMGPYRILGPLGRGGMGVVYRAEHIETGAFAAVKTVRAASESLVASIRREIHALARLGHPGVVRVLDEGMEGGVPWYAMELLDGRSLRSIRGPATHLMAETVIERTGDEPPAPSVRSDATADLGEVLTLVRRLCATLEFLHGEGIVHRDLKPDNVIVRRSGQPVLVDFGLASFFAGREGRDALDAIAAAGGTLAYMAPEQIRREHVDARADLYALGCIIYELLTGRPPFIAATVEEFVRAHLHATPAPPSTLAPGIPSPLDALVLRLLAKKPADRIGYAADVAAALGRLGAEPEPDSDGPRPRAYLYRPAFAGRADALAELDLELERLLGGAGGVVLVGGESGAGKTRLAIEAGRRAERAGARVLGGECLPPGSRTVGAGAALHPLHAPLERIADRCRELGESETDTLVGARGPLLAHYEPSLAGLPGQTKYPEPAELPPDAARLRLYEALTQTFSAAAHSRPLVLVVDDLQWADELTLGFVEYFAGAEPSEDGSVLLVGTYRSEEQPEAVGRLADAGRARRVDLGRLEEPAVEMIVGGMLALDPPPRDFSRYLSRESEGNPFFVAEYLRAAVEEGLLWRDDAGDWNVGRERDGRATAEDYDRLGLPRSVRALVERRLAGLDADATTVVSAAAILGREAEADLLERVSDREGDRLFEALDELLSRQILEQTPGGRLRFTHDKLREVAYDALSSDERAAFHAAAARALEARPASEHDALAALLGLHWERAGEPARARPHYRTGARRAKRQYAYAEAERLYRAYLALVDVPTAESVEARNELGWDVLRAAGRLEEMANEYSLASDEAERIENRPLLALGLTRLGYAYRVLGKLEAARPYTDRALAVAREVGDPKLEGPTLNNLGNLLIDLGHFGEARTAYEGARVCFRTSGDRKGEFTALGNIGRVLEAQSAFEEASAVYEQALAVMQEIGDKADQMPMLVNLSNLHKVKGDLDASLAYAERALALVREIGGRFWEGFVLALVANTFEVRGDLETARSMFAQAIPLCRAAGNPLHEGEILACLADVDAQMGRTDEARAGYEEALAIHRRAGFRRSEAAALYGLAMLERRTGRLELGERLAGEAEALFRQVSDLARASLCVCERGHVALARGARARDLLDEVEGAASSLGARPTGELGRSLARLGRAVAAFEAGGALVHGECLEDVPEAFR